MAESALRIAVVGHVNAGKTTLVRTLARQAGFGTVAVAPGSTQRAEHAQLPATGGLTLDWVDTPGFEDPVALAERLALLQPLAPVERLKALLRQPEVASEHPGEWRALGAARDSDAIVMVVDSVELVLPKHRCTIELLRACARPMVVVLNRPGDPGSRADEWAEALPGHGLVEVLRYDAFTPDPQAEARLMRTLSGLLAPRRPEAAGLEAAWRVARQARLDASLGFVAEAVVGLAARRETLPRAVAGDQALKAEAMARFRQAVLEQAEAAQQALIAFHGFLPEGPMRGPIDSVAGRWEDDLFNAEVLKDAGGKLAGGAAIGAAIGLGADVALAGLSLGTGAAVGAAVGSIASQGFAPTGRKLLNRVTGQLDLTVEDAVLIVLADRLMAVQGALETRGHGASGPWGWTADTVFDGSSAAALVGAASAARGHPEWVSESALEPGEAAARRKVIDGVAARLAGLRAQRPAVSA